MLNVPDGFIEYLSFDYPRKYTAQRVFVDERLANNEIVEKSISNIRQLYENLLEEQKYIDIQKRQLGQTYLNIEKQLIREKINSAELKIQDIIEEMNKNLDPFCWEDYEYDGQKCLFLLEQGV